MCMLERTLVHGKHQAPCLPEEQLEHVIVHGAGRSQGQDLELDKKKKKMKKKRLHTREAT